MQGLISGTEPARNQANSMRVNALIQIAHGMSADRTDPGRPYADLRVVIGATHDGVYRPALTFANGDFDLANVVARGELDLASVNPSAYLTMACRGTGPFAKPLDLRVIAVMPTLDVMLFAVSGKSGLHSLADIRERKYPLHVSIRRSLSHGTRFVIDQVLAANGFSLADLESWGGKLHYVDTPNHGDRLDAIRNGSIEAVFDEGVKGWGRVAAQNSMRFLDMDPASRKRLGELGWALCPVRPLFPNEPADSMAPSFSGWPIFTRADLPEQTAYQMARALDEAWERLAWDSDDPVHLSDVCVGTDAAPRDVPLHPGAARYYREHGCAV